MYEFLCCPGQRLLQLSESGISSTLSSRVSTDLLVNLVKGAGAAVWLLRMVRVYCVLLWELEWLSLKQMKTPVV